MSVEAEAAASATPQLRAATAARELGARELADWCAEILPGALGLTEQDRHDPVWLAGRAWTSWGDPTTWRTRPVDGRRCRFRGDISHRREHWHKMP